MLLLQSFMLLLDLSFVEFFTVRYEHYYTRYFQDHPLKFPKLYFKIPIKLMEYRKDLHYKFSMYQNLIEHGLSLEFDLILDGKI